MSLDMARWSDVTQASSDEAARVRRAVAAFQQMMPGYLTYARAVCRNSTLKLEITSSTPRTDGKTIWLYPPMELGDVQRHDRAVCGVRDYDEIQRCPACRTREFTDIILRHEIGHIAMGTFQRMTDEDRIAALQDGLRLSGGDQGTRAAKLMSRMRGVSEFMPAAQAVSPFMPMILNALEDVRVNIGMYEARPGLLKQFRALNASVAIYGLEGPDGVRRYLNESQPNSQAIIGVFYKCASYNTDGVFIPEVQEMLADPRLDAIVVKVQQARSIRSVFRQAFPVLEILREYGFCRDEEDPEDDEPQGGQGQDDETTEQQDEPKSEEASGSGAGEQDEESEGSEGEASEDDGSEPAGDDADASGSDGTDDDSEPASGDPGDESGDAGDDAGAADATPTERRDSGDEDQGDPAQVEAELQRFSGHENFTHEIPCDLDAPAHEAMVEQQEQESFEVERALVQGECFDEPSPNVFDVRVYDANSTAKGSGWKSGPDEYYNPMVETPETIMSSALQKMRIAFSDNHKARRARNLKSGRIDARTLGRRVPTEDPRIFHKRRELAAKDYFVLVGLDISGSTQRGTLGVIKSAALAQAELLHRAGIKFAVYAHTGGVHKTGQFHALAEVAIYQVKSPTERWDDLARDRLGRLKAGHNNLDGHTLEFYRKVSQKVQATDKLILYFTDGQMPAANGPEELAILQRELRDAPKYNIKVIGVGVGTDSPKRHGLDTIRLNGMHDVPAVVDGLRERLAK